MTARLIAPKGQENKKWRVSSGSKRQGRERLVLFINSIVAIKIDMLSVWVLVGSPYKYMFNPFTEKFVG